MQINSHIIQKIKHKYSMLLMYLVLVCLLSVLCWTFAHYSINQQLTHSLQQQLPSKLQNALYYSDDHGPIVQLIERNINNDLSTVGTSGYVPLLSQCKARVVNLMSINASHSDLWFINLEWLLGNNALHTLLTFECDTHWGVTAFYASGFAILLMLFWYNLPKPLNGKGQHIFQQLQQQLSVYQAHQLAAKLSHFNGIQQKLLDHFLNAKPAVQDIPLLLSWLQQPKTAELDEQQLAWFILASEQYHFSKEQALDAALAPATLNFTSEQGQVVIHGLNLNLVKTPYFYYLWYASLRVQGEGWQLNPPVNRSDKVGATVLLELMQNGGGHSKAINDLIENGLRAKTLDQNRNKLKAELISLLGENLAQDYLFDTERDLKSGRYRYRLSLSSQAISLPPTLNITQQTTDK